MKYLATIGLEIHAELLTDAKVYCSCRAEFGGEENSRVCPICLGLPGTLPSVNQNAVKYAVKAGIALGCKINNFSAFDRKNYYYPDLPKAYQITQFEYPVCTDGKVEVNGRTVRINRIHIEEDAGKLIHKEDVSLVNYNRCGVPLIEIVTEPDIHSGDAAAEFVMETALRLKYAGVCSGRMEQGAVRADVNISLAPIDSQKLGTRAEIKNINSYRSIIRAIRYEIERQTKILDSGNAVIQETRRFNETDGKTYSMRSKEEAQDYRYFPEPDLLPVYISDEEIEEIRKSMPEMPSERVARYVGEYGLLEETAKMLAANKDIADFYDDTVKIYPSYREVCNMVTGELMRNLGGGNIAEMKVTAESLAELIKMSDEGKVSKNSAKDIFAVMFKSGGNAMDIAVSEGMLMSGDTEELAEFIDKIISENEESVKSYKSGTKKAFGYLMGQIVRGMGKSVNPKSAQEILLEKLEKI